MNVRLKVVGIMILIILCTTNFTGLAANKPPTPSLSQTIDLGWYEAVVYQQGANTLCMTVVGKIEKETQTIPVGKCFVEAREFVFSDPLTYDQGSIYTFTVDLAGRPDKNCSVSLTMSGAAIFCPEVL